MNVNDPTGLLTIHHKPGLAIASVTLAGRAGLPITYAATAAYALGDEAAREQAEGQAVAQLADDLAFLVRHRFAPPSASRPQTPGGSA